MTEPGGPDGDGPTFELLDASGAPVGRTEAAESPRGRSLLDRPVSRRWAVVVGALALVGGGLVVVRWLPAPPPAPRLVVGEAQGSAGPRTSWTEGRDGRPVDALLFSAAISVRRTPGGATDTERSEIRVLAPVGPGFERDLAPGAAPVPASGEPADVVLQQSVDCDAVPVAPAPDVYRLKVWTGSTTETRTDLVSVGDVGARWAHDLGTACAAYRARRDLTVSAVTTQVDPERPRVRGTITIDNAGSGEATVAAATSDAATLGGPFPATVPAQGSVTLPIDLTVERCGDVPGTGGRPVRWSDAVQVVAAAGPTVPAAPVRPGESAGSVGIVLGEAARAELARALDLACAGLGPAVAFVDRLTVRLTPPTAPPTAALTAHVLIDLTPGVVRSVRVTPLPDTAPAGSPDRGPTPQWTQRGPLRPSSTGQVALDAEYRVAIGGGCSSIPVFPGLVLSLEVPRGEAVRTVRMVVPLDLTTGTGLDAALGCAPAAGSP